MKTNLKRMITLVLAILLLASVAGCGSTATTTAATTAATTTKAATTAATTAGTTAGTTAPGAKVKAAFIVADMANESQAFSSREFTKYGAQYGFEVSTFDAKADTQTESKLVTNCIAQGFKVIWLNPNDIKAIVPSLMEAKKAGIVIGMFSSDLGTADQQYRDFFCGVNDLQAGEAAAKAFMDKFPNGASIVEIGGQSGHDAQIKRHDGFNKVIANTNIKVIDYQAPTAWSTEQAQKIAEDMIVRHGDKIQGIFCHWDNGATGIIQALKTAKKTGVFLVGVDGNKAGFAQVKEGTQSVTISQNFTNMTKKSLELAQSKVAGKTVEQINFIPLDVISQANIAQFPTPEW